MGHGRSNNVDKIPTFNPQLENTEEIGFQSSSNEAGCCTGITGVGTVDVPLNVLSHFPSFHLGDMPLSGVDWMMGAYQLNNYHNCMLDPHLMNRIDYMPSQNSTLGNGAPYTGGLQMGMQGAKVDDGKPQSIGNFMSCGSREPLLWGTQDGREMGSNNNLVDCMVQSDFPDTLDGSFLTLGVGVDTEARSKSKIDGAINTQLNPSHGQSGYESSFSPDFRMAVGLPDFQTYAGGFSSLQENTVGLSCLERNFGGVPSIVQNAGESSNVSAFAGAEQNVDGCSLSEYNLGVSSNTSFNISLNPLQKLPMPQSHLPHPFLTPGDQKIGAGFANIDPNLSGVSPNLRHIINHPGLPPNQGFHILSGVPPVVHSSSQSGLPVQAQHRMAPWPSLSSYKTSENAKLASDQLQKCNMGSITNFQWDTSVASPVLGNINSCSNQYQPGQPFACDKGASQVSSSVPYSKNLGVQTASTDTLSVSVGSAAEVVNIIPSLKNIGVQAASQAIPSARGSGPAMTSNLLTVPSLKRKAAQPPPATPVQIKRMRSVKPSIHSSTLYKAQDAPSVAPLPPVASQAASVPSLAQSTSSVPPVKLTARPLPPLAHKGPSPRSLPQATPAYPPLTRTTLIPPSARMSPSLHIKWQDSEQLQLSGHNCLLCKRDLSYTPEGRVFQPPIPPPVAVLACGHRFHDLCLQRITPRDQADNPPCIPCAISES